MKQNKMISIILFALLILLAVSCSSEPVEETAANVELPEAEVITTSNQAEIDSAEDEVPGFQREGVQSTNLMMATFQLESTEHEITAEQAAELLPLWKVYQNLIESDTAAEAEREALINQIAGVMTDEQMAYLDSDEIDPAETQALMEEYGIEMGGVMGMGNRPGSGEDGEGFSEAEREEMQAMRETMGGEGSGPGGGQGGFGGQDMDPEQLATMQAERAAEGGGVRGGGQMDEYLLPALIELLESKL